MKKTNNKGFSLVELIVVIAIMAVLVGVLAPALLRYVESSRVGTDNQAISEIASAIKTAAASETIYDEILKATDTVTVEIDESGNLLCPNASKLQAEIRKTIGTVTMKSKLYTGSSEDGVKPVFTVKADSTSDGITVTLGTYFKSNDSSDKETDKTF